MDWRSFLVGWGVGVICWWAQGLIVSATAKRKLRILFEQLERTNKDHLAGRRCELPQCDYCARPEAHAEMAETPQKEGTRT